MGITADEGKILNTSQKQLDLLSIQKKGLIVDDKYATYKNITQNETKATNIIYKIAIPCFSKLIGDPA